MATPMKPPNSAVTVRVADGLVERYEAAGWSKVEKPAPKKATKKS